MKKNEEIWAVATDLSKVDLKIFEYILYLHSTLRPKKIHFVHVVKKIKSSSSIPNEYTEIFQNQLTEEKHLQHDFRVNQFFGDSEVDFECHTFYGSPMDELLDFARNKSVRLVIAGRKKHSGGAGIVSDRLAGMLTCNFLIVPEDFKPKLKKILVTTDFSEHSTLALHRAMEIKESNPEIELFIHHGYKVPMGYSKSRKTFEEFAEIMKSNAEDEASKWIKPYKAEVLLSLRDDEPLLNQTMAIVRDHDIDMVVIGSKGQTPMSVALLGSHTLKLLKGNDLIPVLIIKKQGENHDLLEAIKSI